MFAGSFKSCFECHGFYHGGSFRDVFFPVQWPGLSLKNTDLVPWFVNLHMPPLECCSIVFNFIRLNCSCQLVRRLGNKRIPFDLVLSLTEYVPNDCDLRRGKFDCTKGRMGHILPQKIEKGIFKLFLRRECVEIVYYNISTK
ncbi:hypothetical protein Tsubulata_034989 [Turnera subulata]|uniref:Uncharacterized protein n=1 Tax=Turnera subulata TaxID=218843 RepID=A0A9Q0JJY5_9ROSI|nr:hypothetical protein Tsubulata_034989 [Turnera subulata]